jgi:hypothetical protein
MDGRLCDTSTISRKKPKTSHIGRHFIKAPQTMVWSDSQYCAWINSAGLGLDPLSEIAAKAKEHNIRVSPAVLDAASKDGEALLQSLHTTTQALRN